MTKRDGGRRRMPIAGHSLSPGLEDLLECMTARGIRVACLSNDVSEWAALQRDRFGLAELIDPWCISGDVDVSQARHPQTRIASFVASQMSTAAQFAYHDHTVVATSDPDNIETLTSALNAQVSILTV